MRKINPLNDFIFKKLFGEEDSKEMLISFLNAVLSKQQMKPLVDVEIIKNRELNRELIDDKMGILDIRAKLSDSTQVNIEVQLTNHGNMEKRTLWYWGRIFNEGIAKGDDYSQLTKVITINLLDFKYIKVQKYHSTFHLWEDEALDCKLTDLIEIHFIELPKFHEMPVKHYHENKLERWLAFFNKNISDTELEELIEMDADIRQAEEKIDYFSRDRETMAMYTARELALHDKTSMMNHAKNEGIKEEKYKTARKMIKAGSEISFIIEMTELTRDEVINLMNELDNSL